MPCSATIQNCEPTRPSPTGVRRDFPVLRPVVSRSAYPGGARPIANESLIGGLSKYFCSRRTMRYFMFPRSLFHDQPANNTPNLLGSMLRPIAFERARPFEHLRPSYLHLPLDPENPQSKRANPPGSS